MMIVVFVLVALAVLALLVRRAPVRCGAAWCATRPRPGGRARRVGTVVVIAVPRPAAVAALTSPSAPARPSGCSRRWPGRAILWLAVLAVPGCWPLLVGEAVRAAAAPRLERRRRRRPARPWPRREPARARPSPAPERRRAPAPSRDRARRRPPAESPGPTEARGTEPAGAPRTRRSPGACSSPASSAGPPPRSPSGPSATARTESCAARSVKRVTVPLAKLPARGARVPDRRRQRHPPRARPRPRLTPSGSSTPSTAPSPT